MTAALPFMALPLTLAGPLPTAAAANSSASSQFLRPGPATVLHSGPTPWSVPHHLGGVVCNDDRTCQEVYYQAIQSFGPIELGLPENLKALEFAVNNAPGDKVLYGYSGGARVVSAWLDHHGNSTPIPTEDLSAVLVGNGGRKYGGINGFFWGGLYNPLMTPTGTPISVVDVAREYDPVADFPGNPFNVLALANAASAFMSVHLGYSDVDLDAPGNYVWTEGNTTYVYIPSQHLPLLQGLRDLGLNTLADQWEAPLREIIDRAYTRDYLANATVIPEAITEEESIGSAKSASSTSTSGTGEACSGYNTDGCDILLEQSYQPVTAPDLESAAWRNVLPNLFNAVASIPRAYLDALNDVSHSFEVTGSWWVYTPTNVLGYDPADPPKITAVTNLTIPFKALSNPLGEHVSWWAKANLPMNAGCTATAPPTCLDAEAILNKMFLVPIWDLIAGYQFPELNNPVSDAEGAVGEEIAGEEGAPVPWSGAAVQLNPMDPVYSVLNYLLAPPSQNRPEPITLNEVVQALVRFGAAAWVDFNPFVPGSFLWKGAPYTLVTPLLKPFVRILCPQCDPEHPEDPTPFVDDEVPSGDESTGSSVTALAVSTAEVGDQGSSEAAAIEADSTEQAPADARVAEDAQDAGAVAGTGTAEDAADAGEAADAGDGADAGDTADAEGPADAADEGATGADIEQGVDEDSQAESVDESQTPGQNATNGDGSDADSSDSTSQDAAGESDSTPNSSGDDGGDD